MLLLIIISIVTIGILSSVGYFFYDKFNKLDNSVDSIHDYNKIYSKKNNIITSELQNVDSQLKYVDSELISNQSSIVNSLGTVENKFKSQLDEINTNVSTNFVSKEDLGNSITSKYGQFDNSVIQEAVIQEAMIHGSFGSQNAVIRGSLESQDAMIHGSLGSQNAIIQEALTSQDAVIKGSLTSQNAIIQGSLTAGSSVIQENTLDNIISKKLQGIDAEFNNLKSTSAEFSDLLSKNGFSTGTTPNWRWSADDNSQSLLITNSLATTPIISIKDTIDLNKNVNVNNDINIIGKLQAAKGLSVLSANPGPLVEKRYGSDGDRYGVGQFNNGMTRMYTATAYPGKVAMSLAKTDGSFDDIVTVNPDRSTSVSTKMTVGDSFCVGTTCVDPTQFQKLKNLLNIVTNITAIHNQNPANGNVFLWTQSIPGFTSVNATVGSFTGVGRYTATRSGNFTIRPTAWWTSRLGQTDNVKYIIQVFDASNNVINSYPGAQFTDVNISLTVGQSWSIIKNETATYTIYSGSTLNVTELAS